MLLCFLTELSNVVHRLAQIDAEMSFSISGLSVSFTFTCSKQRMGNTFRGIEIIFAKWEDSRWFFFRVIPEDLFSADVRMEFGSWQVSRLLGQDAPCQDILTFTRGYSITSNGWGTPWIITMTMTRNFCNFFLIRVWILIYVNIVISCCKYTIFNIDLFV